MHPMYEIARGNSLRQGDILDAMLVRKELKGHLDYFADKPYFTAFCVLTQSCDLHREWQVDFVTLAVVRDLTDAFARHLPISADKTRTQLESIISHNWNKRGYFYLHPNRDTTIHSPSVADLRVCVSVSLNKVDGHYEQLLAARRASLRADYAAALGWMASQLYGRVATPDWNDLGLYPSTSSEYVEMLWQDIAKAKNSKPREGD